MILRKGYSVLQEFSWTQNYKLYNFPALQIFQQTRFCSAWEKTFALHYFLMPKNHILEALWKALKSIYQIAKQALNEKFLEPSAPGQAQSLADILPSNEDNELLESDLDELLNTYKSSDTFVKMIALSFAAQKHSKAVVMEAFNCSKQKVDEARKLQVFSEGIKTPDVSKHNRLRLDINKCNHFLDFTFNNGLLQDIAYGTSVMKYTNG